jgi:predicted enzyme related to lactoylglutathione lyase
VANTLIFVDFPSSDPAATAQFYAEVMGWEVEGRPEGIFHRVVPGGEFVLDDGTSSGVGHLHLGIYSTSEPRPDPNPAPTPAPGSFPVPAPRIYILVDDPAVQERILAAAEDRGATVLWRDAYWREFNGWHGSFQDPWGTQIILWTKGAEDSEIPADSPY